MTDNPSTRRTERIMKHSAESNWRSRKWEKPIQEVESPSFTPKTEMSEKLDNDDKQNQRSQLKEIIKQRIESQSIALSIEKPIEEIARVNENEQEQRSRLKEIITQRIKSQLIAQAPFIEEMESDEEEKETEADEGIVGTPEEQKERLIHAYLTMEKDRNEQEEPNKRRELLHAYSKHTMDNDEEQTDRTGRDRHVPENLSGGGTETLDLRGIRQR